MDHVVGSLEERCDPRPRDFRLDEPDAAALFGPEQRGDAAIVGPDVRFIDIDALADQLTKRPSTPCSRRRR